MKNIYFSESAREKLAQGVKALATAVTATLGPNGRNVIIQQEQGNPISTKDGVSVAKAITLEDPIENIGAQLIRQSSLKTADQAGDGTTTSTLLAAELYLQALDRLKNFQCNAVELKRGIDKGVQMAIQEIRNLSKEISDENQLKQVATISGNNDEEIGSIVQLSLDKVGADGIVTVEESRTGETYLEVVEGMQFNRGYKSLFFVKDNKNMTATLTNPYILITDQNITQIKPLLGLLQRCSSENRPLVVVANDIDGEALSVLVVNKQRGSLDVVAVKAPEYGDRKLAVLEDLATLTGGAVIAKDKGMRLEKIEETWLGAARKVVVSKDSTTIIDGKGDEEQILERVESIKNLIGEAKSPFEIEILQDRLARMAGGVSMIHTGGSTELEMKEKKDRIEDALSATKAAISEGILPGGGTALLKIAKKLNKQLEDKTILVEHPDQKFGMELLFKTMEAPYSKILLNAGYHPQQIESITSNILVDSDNFWYGYNPRTEQYIDMYENGIIDPAKVTRLALENAVSVAGTMITTECVVSMIPQEKQENLLDLPVE
jgi:chaperonin GroEL